jgi:hypothetical protein
VAMVATGAVVAMTSGAAFTAVLPSEASSHREAPLILSDPLVDNTDVYAFVSPDAPDYVTLIANWSPFSVPGQGPNLYPWATDARYNIKIDNDGDAVPDITYRWTFETQDERPDTDHGDADNGTFLYTDGPVTSLDDENLLFKQTYTLTRIDAHGGRTKLLHDQPVAPDHVGEASMPDYAALRDEAVVGIDEDDGGGRSFVGRAEDPFFLDIRVFDLIYGADLSQRGDDTLAGFNVNTVALQVPISSLVDDEDPVIGVWSTTERPRTRVQRPNGTQSFTGRYVQVSRLGSPLINEVVLPIGLKDAFNALKPEDDATVDEAVGRVLAPEVPEVIEAIYGIPAPATPRDDLFTIFLTGLEGLNKPAGDVRPAEMLRLNTSIPPSATPNRLGVLAGDIAGYPNGRRLADDVVDIEIQALEGAVSVSGRGGAPTGVTIVEPLAAGDMVNTNDRAFGSVFPYLALPYSASEVVGSVGNNPTPSVGLTSSSTAFAGAAPAGPTGGVVAGSGSSAVPPLTGLVGGLVLALGGLALLRRHRPSGTAASAGS